MRCICLAILATTVGVTPVVAATQVSVQGGGIYGTLSGSDFDNIESGLGFEGQIRTALGRRITLGAGVQHQSYGVTGVDENVGVFAIFIEPRMTWPGTAAIVPYVGARGMYTRFSFNPGGTEVKATGSAFSAAVGALVAFGPGLDLDVALHYVFRVSFGNSVVNGTEQPNSDAHGTGIGVRAALSIGLGGR